MPAPACGQIGLAGARTGVAAAMASLGASTGASAGGAAPDVRIVHLRDALATEGEELRNLEQFQIHSFSPPFRSGVAPYPEDVVARASVDTPSDVAY
jgi:hypothetical protein